MRRCRVFATTDGMMTRLLLNSLRCLRYARSGGVSRVAKGADCKSPNFAFRINVNSEKSRKFDPFLINRLERVSE
jgi:hypothetical protein